MAKTRVDVTAALAAVPVAAVVGGVDTHGRVHVAAAVDQVGRVLGTGGFAATTAGYAQLAAWLQTWGGPLLAVGVEGTGSYGAGLARALSAAEITVAEVDRPDRSARRAHGKDDDLDAITAARAALSGRASGAPKASTGEVEAIRALRVARSRAVKARTAALNQLKDLRVTAPAALRAQLDGLDLPTLAAKAARRRLPAATRPGPRGHRCPDPAALADPTLATKRAMRRLGRRIADLDTEIADADADLAALVAATAPTTLQVYGAGPDSVGQLLVTAGDNPDRLTSESALARLCGIAPVPASSGNTSHMRLHRGGDRAANAAIYRIVCARLRHDPATHAYVARRTAQGLTKRMIIRCLKRYVVRQLYHTLTTDFTKINSLPLAA